MFLSICLSLCFASDIHKNETCVVSRNYIDNEFFSSGVSGNEGDRYKSEFLTLEKEKNRHLKQYREKKLALLENIIKQHDEIIDLQMRSTTALEVIADKFQPQVQIPSPLSVSPIIRFDSVS